MSETADEAELALAGVAADIIESISMARAMELTAGLPGPPRRPRELTPRQRDLADNHDLATTDRPGRPHCAYCGGTAGKLVPGPDREFLGDKADHFCSDERACIARRERRYPLDPSKVPPELMDLARRQDEADAARLPAPPPEPESQPQHEHEHEILPGWQATQYGAWDTAGGWHPGPNRFYADAWAASPWSHTLRNPRHHTHLLGPQAPGLYGHGTGQSAYSNAASGQQGAGQAPGDGGQGDREIPPEGVPESLRAVLEARTGGAGDIPMAPQAAAAPARPARRPRGPQYGRRRGRVRRR